MDTFSDIFYDILKEYKGNKVIFIGEIRDDINQFSITGSIEFHKLLHELFKLKKIIDMIDFGYAFPTKCYYFERKK